MKPIALFASLVLAVLLAHVSSAGANDPVAAYPDRPIRVVVAWPAGGIADTGTRRLAMVLEKILKTTIIVDNRPGASGQIGAESVARAPADGYTILSGDIATHAINPCVFAKLRYDPLKDFAPISLRIRGPVTLVVNAATSIKSVRDLVEQSRRGPEPLPYASPGLGTPQHLQMELLARQTGASLRPVQFKGEARRSSTWSVASCRRCSHSRPRSRRTCSPESFEGAPSPAASGCRACRTFRPSSNWECPTSSRIRGAPSTRPQARRSRSSKSSLLPLHGPIRRLRSSNTPPPSARSRSTPRQTNWLRGTERRSTASARSPSRQESGSSSDPCGRERCHIEATRCHRAPSTPGSRHSRPSSVAPLVKPIAASQLRPR